jgi:amidase
LHKGKTTTTEFAVSRVGPKTRNPHDLNRTPGGSSSGSAAAVADFQAPVGLGSQTSGSIIRPASFNGIYGFKPTWNAISREGQKFHSLLLDTFGIFTRCVEDLELLADVFALVDDIPPHPQFSLQGTKFALVRTTVWPEAGPGTINAIESAVGILKNYGVLVEEVELPPEFDQLPHWHDIIVKSDGMVTFLPEYRTNQDRLPPPIVNFVRNTDRISHRAQLEAFDGIALLRPKIDKIASQYTAIITPSTPDVAPHGQDWTGSPAFNAIWTVSVYNLSCDIFKLTDFLDLTYTGCQYSRTQR